MSPFPLRNDDDITEHVRRHFALQESLEQADRISHMRPVYQTLSGPDGFMLIKRYLRRWREKLPAGDPLSNYLYNCFDVLRKQKLI